MPRAIIKLKGIVGSTDCQTDAEKDLNTILDCLRKDTKYGEGIVDPLLGKEVVLDINIIWGSETTEETETGEQLLEEIYTKSLQYLAKRKP